MKNIILISHGQLASGMLSAVELITGKQEQLHSIDMYLDDEKLVNKFNELVSRKNIELDKTIIVTDILGGSVNQEILTLVNLTKTIVITGMNLPLLLTLVTSNLEEISLENIEGTIKQVNDQILLVNALLNDTEDDF